ncbi:hypothetical protein HBH92_139430 [Parastagonospora nodorum]|nr:hypothetical protein HBH92_139430 [Parastagonospora nodorum]KAH4433837.1 hypothetical protein HBH91_215710 [Parastagonospora nodorum]KAH4490237.1 hypothetical protein HBH89_183630 [Parastagonospora nodorum]KAH4533084.1 hypothetical protein HBH86_204580 [Parastagonospora nodorum]
MARVTIPYASLHIRDKLMSAFGLLAARACRCLEAFFYFVIDFPEPRLPPIRSLKLPSIGSSNASPTTPHSSTPPSHAKERNAKRHDHARMAVPVLQRNKPRPRHA